MTPYETYKKAMEKFSKGYYSFRFEFTDKSGVRRYEAGIWNDGMTPEDALKGIARYVREFKDGSITDFIDNQDFRKSLRSLTLALIDGMIEKQLARIAGLREEKHEKATANTTITWYDGQLDEAELTLSHLRSEREKIANEK